MRRLSLILCIILMSWGKLCMAQDPKTDSLKDAITQLPADTNKVNALLDLSAMIFGKEPDTAMFYAEKALDLSRQLNFKKGEGYALKNIGLAYYVKSDFVEVYNYWQQSLNVFKSINDKLGISNLNNNIGAVHFNNANYSKALTFYFESLKAAEELGDTLRIATAMMNVGAAYSDMKAAEGTRDKAMDYYNRSVPLFEDAGNLDALGTVNANLGELYFLNGDYKTALNKFEKALEALKQSGGNLAFVLTFIGKIYALEGKKELAVQFHNQAIQSALSKDSKYQLTQALIGLADHYQDLGEWRPAIQYYAQAQEIANELDLNAELQEAYAGLASSAASLTDFEKAYEYQQLFNETREKVFSDEMAKAVGNVQFQYDLDKKEAEVELLKKENALSELAVQRANLLWYLFMGIAGFLIIIAGGIYYQYWYARRSNKIISEERNRAESILLNILPADTAQELKEKGYVEAKKFEKTTVLFTDFKNFTRTAEATSPEDLVKSVDYYFTKFDEIVTRHNLEKIKTIGDAYMCAGGLPVPNSSNPSDAVNAAIEMLEAVETIKKAPPEGIIPFDIRLGINTGPVVAGVVGTKKFQYDIWGSTVNLASRMETSSTPGKINISENTYQLVKDEFDFEYRGEIEAKNGELLKMYFLK